MGCEASHNVAIESNPQPNKATSQDKSLLTEIQLDVIKSTWPIIARDINGNGAILLIDIFRAEPTVKHVFSAFKGLDDTSLKSDPRFQMHASMFMETVQLAAEYLENSSVRGRHLPACETIQGLMLLGAKHALIPGFDISFFSTFTKCMHNTWETVLGEEYTAEVRGAWSLVFDFIVKKIKDGYFLYYSEPDDHKQDTKDDNYIKKDS